VVPAQRPPAAPAETQPIPPQPSGQIGGRAMLSPGQSLTDHLAKLQQSNAPAPGRRRAPEMHDAMAGGTTSMMPTAGGADPTSVIPPRGQWDGRVVTSPAAKRKQMIDKTVATVRDGAGKAVTTVKGWPRNKQLIAGGGALAVVLVLILVFSLAGGGNKTAPPPDAQPPAGQDAAPGLPSQEYNDRGISVQVPKGWTRKASGTWVDYADPKDAKHKVRILVEKSTATSTAFLGIAENTLKTRSTNCPKPYARIALDKTAISGKDGAVLEYTCGTGDAARHGLWGAVVTGGKAFSFYMTATEAQFAESKPIFDQMIQTYTLQAS
jgi:hypothetical protein